MFDRLVRMGDIGRRYFVVNSFDGVLTVLGIVMGSFISGVNDPSIVLSAGVGASVALGISGFSSAYLSERAEREKDIKELEGKMLEEMRGKRRVEELVRAPLKISIVNSLSPLLTGLLCIVPFLLSSLKVFDVTYAYHASIGVGLSLLFLLGYFLGRISKKGRILNALKMLLVGMITVILMYSLGLGGF